MKKTISTIMFLFCAIMSIQAALPSNPAIEEKEPIGLKGENKDDREKSQIIPFEAWLVDNEEVEVLSYHACTDVTISICTISGQVLDSQTLPLASIQSVIFNIADYASGYYQVNITTPNKTEYIGTFMIE